MLVPFRWTCGFFLRIIRVMAPMSPPPPTSYVLNLVGAIEAMMATMQQQNAIKVDQHNLAM